MDAPDLPPRSDRRTAALRRVVTSLVGVWSVVLLAAFTGCASPHLVQFEPRGYSSTYERYLLQAGRCPIPAAPPGQPTPFGQPVPVEQTTPAATQPGPFAVK
jgi:hypothetical protein